MSTEWAPYFTAKDFTILSERDAYSGYCAVKQFRFQFSIFAGGVSHPVEREMVCRPPAVAVLLYDPDTEKVVMIEQFRTGAMEETSPWILEIVAGMVDPGETPESTAFRETFEETGCTLLSLTPICTFLVSPGISNEKTYIYYGRVKTPKGGDFHGLLDDGEDIKVHVFPKEVVFDLLKKGKITSASAVIAIQWLQINHETLHFPL